MLASGFVDGELIYVIEFDFNNQGFKNRLQKQLNRKFPEGDQSGDWLRSAHFSFTHFKDDGYIKIYVHKNIENYSNFLTKDLYKELSMVKNIKKQLNNDLVSEENEYEL